MQPASFIAGRGGAELEVDGDGFTPESRVQWNAQDRATTQVSPGRLRAALREGDLAAAGMRFVAVVNGTTSSAAVPVEVRNAVPVLVRLVPDTLTVAGSNLMVQLAGHAFVPESRVRLNDEDRTTTFVADSMLEVRLQPADVAAVSTLRFTVYNPPPGGGTSGSRTAILINPQPVITSVAPDRLVLGQEPVLMVAGSGFVAGTVVLWNGYQLAGTFLDATRIEARGPLFLTGTAGTYNITVRTPLPGGGTSASVPVVVENTLPVLTSISPDSIESDEGAVSLVLAGSNFAVGAVVEIGGVERSAIRESSTRMVVQLTAVQTATPGSLQVVVRNPLPGGGASGPLTFRIIAAPPRLSGLAPSSVVRGSGPFTLAVSGRNFTAGSVVLWNGAPRPTTFVTPGSLRAEISGADIESGSNARVAVRDPGTGRTSTAMTLAITPPDAVVTPVGNAALVARDIVYDPVRNRVYASIGSGAAQLANTIAILDPTTGGLISTISVPGNPGPLAIATDASFLYAGLGDVPRVTRIDLAAGAPDLEIDVTVDTFCGMNTAEDMETLPGLPRAVVVSVKNNGCSPRHEGVYLFDDTLRRPRGTPGHTGSNRITRGHVPGQLFGYNNESSEFGLRRIDVVPDGLVEITMRGGLVSGYGVDIVQDGGYIYSTNGRVADATSLTPIGTLPSTGPSLHPDAARGRVYFITSRVLQVHHYTSLTKIGEVPLEFSGSPVRLIRWGSDGLALASTTRIWFMRTTLTGS